MQEHVGVAGVGHRARALVIVDALAKIGHSVAVPDGADVVGVIAEVSGGFGADTAAPNIAIGGNLATGPTSITRNDLPVLIQCALS